MGEMRRQAVAVILLFGFVSLLGDVIYEGGRGVIPPYLIFLGASPIVVGLVGGVGDFVSNALRVYFGYLADKTRNYMRLIIVGYLMIIFIPLLALVKRWELAGVFIVIERMGKALRMPARDTILSQVGQEIGVGKAFGVHEFLDQVGAVLGPLITTVILVKFTNSYQFAFSWGFIPFILLVVLLLYISNKLRHLRITLSTAKSRNSSSLNRQRVLFYNVAVLLNTLGLVYPLLIIYKGAQILQQAWVAPTLYLLIQIVDAPAALLAGSMFDKHGLKILYIPILLSVFPSVATVTSREITLLIASSLIYGIILGIQESTFRAAVYEMSGKTSGATSYGLFGTFYGLGFMGSGILYGYLLQTQINLPLVILLVAVIQMLSLLFMRKALHTA